MPLLRSTVMMSIPEEPAFLRRVSLSLLAMGILTGAGLRSYRAFVLTFGWSDSWLWIGGTFLGGAFFLFLMATLHLGNYSVRAWWWRAPAFAVVEATTEIAASLVLTLAGLELVGSAQATLEDWQFTSTRILFVRVAGIVIFTFILAIVSTGVRWVLVRNRGEGKSE